MFRGIGGPPEASAGGTCTADPNVEANWHDAGTFNGGKATITGLTPGSTVWVRIRTLGLQNVKGAWSDPAQIMVV